MRHEDKVLELYDTTHKVAVAHINLTSRATSLGASSPAPGVVKMSLDRKVPVTCVKIPDELSMRTAELFAGKHTKPGVLQSHIA